jgi:acyl carrier protein
MHDHITDQLRHMIAEKLNLNLTIDQVNPDAQLLEGGLKLDSLALVELITLIEDHFGIQFGEIDFNIEVFGNLRSLAALVRSRCELAA